MRKEMPALAAMAVAVTMTGWGWSGEAATAEKPAKAKRVEFHGGTLSLEVPDGWGMLVDDDENGIALTMRKVEKGEELPTVPSLLVFEPMLGKKFDGDPSVALLERLAGATVDGIVGPVKDIKFAGCDAKIITIEGGDGEDAPGVLEMMAFVDGGGFFCLILSVPKAEKESLDQLRAVRDTFAIDREKYAAFIAKREAALKAAEAKDDDADQ